MHARLSVMFSPFSAKKRCIGDGERKCNPARRISRRKNVKIAFNGEIESPSRASQIKSPYFLSAAFPAAPFSSRQTSIGAVLEPTPLSKYTACCVAAGASPGSLPRATQTSSAEDNVRVEREMQSRNFFVSAPCGEDGWTGDNREKLLDPAPRDSSTGREGMRESPLRSPLPLHIMRVVSV